MIIKDIKYKRFQINLTQPFISANQVITQRKGFYLIVTDEFDNVSYGEVITLPGFSIENLEESENDIKRLVSLLSRKTLTNNFFELKNKLSDLNLVPSVQFGIEQALLSLLFKQNHDLITNFLNVKSKTEIHVNAVIGIGKKEEVVSKAQKYIDLGFKTLKTKIGREKFEEDLQVVDTLRNDLGDDFNLRLDANGSWTTDEAFENINKLSSYHIQYIEDACSNLSCLEKLSKLSPVPIAVDQTIKTFSELNFILDQDSIKFVVIKPIVLGSILKLIEFVELANKKKINVIISSGFESSIGRSLLVFLSSLTNHNYAHGLATSEYINSDSMNNFYKITDGKIKFDPTNYPPQFSI